MTEPAAAPPPSGTVERWAYDYVTSSRLERKLVVTPPALDEDAAWEVAPPVRRLAAPGRPSELEVVEHTKRSVSTRGLGTVAKRAQVLHTFWHHELQAAELMCWALLAFPRTPRAFRRGLAAICLDEIRHMHLYRRHLADLGYGLGAFPVRDWFWQRVPQCAEPVQFVALLGMGFEGGNLDHAARFATAFRAAGDPRAAAIQEQVGREEVAHVKFAVEWFRAWTGGVDFDVWRQALVAPLTPTMMRGKHLNVVDRRQSGLPDAFLAALERVRAG